MTELSIQSILGPDGRIAKRIRNYEHRTEQMEMANAVESALRDRKHLVVEAGTGVGKSFGYLVPAILHATAAESRLDRKTANPDNPESHTDADLPDEEDGDERAKRIIISTHTISLQEQLIGKDLPLLNAVIPREFSSVLVKGRGNYVSKRRLSLAHSRMTNLLSQERDYEQMQSILKWSLETADGSLSSLPFRPINAVWDEIASDSGNCMGRKCEHYAACHYYAARRRVHNSQILVVNHALFFSDLALRAIGSGILPKYDAVIFDECHTIESVAGDHLGLSVSNSQVDYTLRKLYNPKTEKGILFVLGLKQVMQQTYQCMEALDDLVFELAGWLESQSGSNGRIRERLSIDPVLVERLRDLSIQLERYGKDHKDSNARLDLMSASKRLMALAKAIDHWIGQKFADSVYWLERQQSRGASRTSTRITLRSSPIDVGSHLREQLFQKVPSVIMTSATLSGGKGSDFRFFQGRIGAIGSQSLQVGSPFDYQRLAELHLITDLPDPAIEKLRYEEALIPVLQHYVGMCDGHAFLLFTSYDLLTKTCAAMTPWLNRHDLAIYSQADGSPRNQLLNAFKENPRGVLFGAESFWQGVDVPGDALRLVAITKLPFSVPDHPLLEARLEAIRQGGGNPFRDFQLPEAVIKFRQGFGRLIRTATDSGIVLVTDPRIVSKPYGQVFVESVPKCTVRHVLSKRLGSAVR